MFSSTTMRATSGFRSSHVTQVNVVPAPAPRLLAPRGSNRARALLLDKPVQEQGQQQPNVIENGIRMLISWLEPPQHSDKTDDLPEYMKMEDDADAGHGSVWGHSHIADRLATEPSSRTSVASYDI